MAKTNKIRLYAFVAAIMVLLLPIALFYLRHDSSPLDSDHTSSLPTQDTKPSPATRPPTNAAPANTIQKPTAKNTEKRAPTTVEPVKVQRQPASTSLISTENLGKTITVEGVPINYKIEAAVSSKEGGIVWLKGLGHWPNDVVSVHGKRVRVTGFLSEDYGGGAVIWGSEGGNRQMAHGHPVPPGTDLKKVNHRFIIINAKWEVTDK